MAPSAAVMSRALVISKTQTYWPKISSATPVTLPVLALTSARPFMSPRVTAPMAVKSRPPSPKARSSEAHFWPLIVSTSESDESTPTSIRTNRKSIMTAPV